MGGAAATELTRGFLSGQSITHADEVAPLGALDPSFEAAGWGDIYVATAVHGNVGLLSLKRTTINHVFVAELDAAIERLQADPAVASIVVAPDGHFSREFGHGADGNCFLPVLGRHDAALGLIQKWKQTLAKLRRGKPTVAALVGRVLGGGLEMACNCHARIAAAGTRLAQPEPVVGVIPGLGGCHHIHRFSKPESWSRINELLLSGYTFDAEEAVGFGLVAKTVPVRDLPRESMAYAAELAKGGVPAFREGPAVVVVDRNVATRTESGVPHDADLRELLAETIEHTNALPYAEASALEEVNAAKSLTMSSSRIGVAAMLRGKAPEFERPLA
jgi:enoyl-CoA hydratase/carnithine racemase